MPWSGGVYTRGYPSWTNDANSNLPISATKFDTEDNDFAAGLNNCLTIDGLNKPTASLNWTQQINLSRATDGQLASWARTGGTNNPSLTLSVVDATSGVNLAPSGTIQINAAAVASLPVTISGVSSGQAAQAFNVNNTLKAIVGVAGAAGQIVAGAATNDMVVRAQGGNLLLTTDSGASIGMEISGANAAVSFKGPTAAAQVDMTPDTGTFVPATTGFSSVTSATGAWYRIGKLMLLQMVISGTSNATGFSVTNLPAACQPPAQGVGLTTFGGTDNGNSALLAEVLVAAASATVTFQLAKTNTVTNDVQGVAGSWTASGTKGISFSVAYFLN